MGASQVPRPTLMSCHYPANTAAHVVSDQLGRHKGRGLELSWGLRQSAGYIQATRPLISLSPRLSNLLSLAKQRGQPDQIWGGSRRRGRGNFAQHLVRDSKQGLQQTRPAPDLSSSLLSSTVENTHNKIINWLQVIKLMTGLKQCVLWDAGNRPKTKATSQPCFREKTSVQQ